MVLSIILLASTHWQWHSLAKHPLGSWHTATLSSLKSWGKFWVLLFISIWFFQYLKDVFCIKGIFFLQITKNAIYIVLHVLLFFFLKYSGAGLASDVPCHTFRSISLQFSLLQPYLCTFSFLPGVNHGNKLAETIPGATRHIAQLLKDR